MATATTARHRRTLLTFAPLVGLFVAAMLVWQVSTAAFTATTTNENNSWATGTVALQNNGGNGGTGGSPGSYAVVTTPGLFGEANLRPGSTGTSCITVQSNGTLGGNLRMLRGTTFTGNPALANNINLTIDARARTTSQNVPATCAGFTSGGGTPPIVSIYSGTLAGLPTTFDGAGPLNNVVVDDGPRRVAYRIAWELDSATTLEGATVTGDLIWELQTVAP